MDTDFVAVPDWFPRENAGAGIAVADVNDDGLADVVVFMVDDAPARTPATTGSAGRRTTSARSLTGRYGPLCPTGDRGSTRGQGSPLLTSAGAAGRISSCS